MKTWLYASRVLRSHNVHDGGHNKKREDLCVQREGGGGVIYVNNLHFPSAAVCITQHGFVVMVIATGQMMWKWVHLVMNFSSADGCLTGVHFQTIHNVGPPRGSNSTSSTAADVLKVTNFHADISDIFFNSSCYKVVSFSIKYEELISVYHGEAD